MSKKLCGNGDKILKHAVFYHNLPFPIIFSLYVYCNKDIVIYDFFFYNLPTNSIEYKGNIFCLMQWGY